MRLVARSTALGCALCATALAAPPAPAPQANRPNSPAVDAIARDYQLLNMVDGDVDGDGKLETFMLFADGKEGSGVLVMGTHEGAVRYRGCVYLDGVVAQDVAVVGKDLTLQLLLDGVVKPYVLTVGKDVGLRGGEGDPVADAKVTASSEHKGGMNTPARAVDQDVGTSWAEGSDGTGIGETLTFQFARPFALALVGVFPGDGRGLKEFKDANRVRHLSVEVQDPAQAGDEKAGIDFADLGITAHGARTEMKFANKPEMKFVRVSEEHAQKVILHVDAVYLGDKKDDTHIAEVAFCQLVTDARIKADLRRNKRVAPDVKTAPAADRSR